MLEYKKPETVLNKGTKYKKNYIEGLKSKNKNIKGDGPLKILLTVSIL